MSGDGPLRIANLISNLRGQIKERDERLIEIKRLCGLYADKVENMDERYDILSSEEIYGMIAAIYAQVSDFGV